MTDAELRQVRRQRGGLIETEILAPPAPLLPLGPIQRQSFDYSGLDAAMEFTDEAMRKLGGCSPFSRRAVAPEKARVVNRTSYCTLRERIPLERD